MREEFDYIIVGSGTAGSTLASRLSEDPACRVLVLEAGGKDNLFWLKMPVGYFRTIYDPRASIHFKADPDAGIAGRQMNMPRGKVVGGSSSINGLIFIRGQHEDFDDWESMGAQGWAYRDVLPFFRNLECYEGQPSQHRGAHGPVHVSDLRNKNPACEAWMQAAQEFGLPANPDFNGENTHGVGEYQLTLRGRWRESAATAFLHPALKRKNLTLRLHAQVTTLAFEGRRVVGLNYVQDGQHHTVHAAREVILSGGSLQSPQLLQLSGIGPGDLLKKHGIKVRRDAPEVGQNLQDHLQMRTMVELSNPKESLNHQIRHPLSLARMGLEWLLAGKGPLTVGAGQVGGSVCTRHAESNRPDVQLFVFPLAVPSPGAPIPPLPGFTVSFWQCHPESRGDIAIRSDDPFEAPAIRPNYLQTARDRDVMVEGLKIAREIYRQPAFSDRWKREVLPGEDVRTDSEILAAIQQGATTVYHPVGTCRMGEDDGAVVNSQLCVHDIEGLRVADASVMPKITSANTNAATYMIAEKAAAFIKNA